VAVDNARQLQRDIVLTVSAMLILLLVILLRYFRRKRVPFIILVPVAFGALFALCCVAIIQGSLSILALAVGAIILGVAVDYSLHFLVHLKHTQSLEQVISDLVKPLTLGSLTTVAAFFCLRFTNAIVLQDIGLFAGFSLIGAALCSLLILPHLVSPHVIDRREGLLDRWTGVRRKESRYLVYGIVLITPFFLYKAGSVRFNNDVSTLNFMTAETRKAQERLETLTKASLNSVYVLASGRTLEEALQKNEQTLPRLRDLKERGVAQKISSVSSFLVSDSLQQLRIKRWNAFWSTGQKEALRDVVHREGAKLKFSTKVLQNFDERLSRPYTILPAGTRQAMQDAFYRDYVLQNAHKVTVITLAQVAPWQKDDLYQALKETPSQATDRQQLANLFVEYVHADFNFIVTFTGVLVFLVLLISYGRIEIT
jgi:uncharacterized protein